MNLPIVQSILHGALRPHHLLVETNYSGRQCYLPYIYTHYKNIIRKDSNIYKNSLILNAECMIPYRQITNIISQTPNTQEALEEVLEKNLAPYVSFKFSDQQTVNPNIIEEKHQEYTDITMMYFSPDIEFKLRETKNPIEKFYFTLIKAESERIKTTLLNYAKACQSDLYTRCEIKEILSTIALYINDCKNNDIDKLLFSKHLNRNLTENELQQYDSDYNLYPVFKNLLIKLYLEISLMFNEILNRDISFDDFMYEHNDQYPSEDEKLAFNTAKLIYDAQLAIKHNQDVRPILLKAYRILLCQLDNNKLLNTIRALENYDFISANNIKVLDFKDLLDDATNNIFKDYKDNLQNLNHDKTNPRELLENFMAEAESLLFFSENKCSINSIPRQILDFINEQIELCKTNIAGSFLPIASSAISQKNIKSKMSKKGYNDIIKAVKKRLDFFSGCNLGNEKIMKEDDYNKLIEIIKEFVVNEKIPVLHNKINVKLPITFIRYTFYLIWKEDCFKKPSRNKWVELIHSLFDFGNTEITTSIKKFSEKPDNYDNDIKCMDMEKNKQ